MTSVVLNKENVPRTIWFFWLQGLDCAPLVVKKCYESWVRHNFNWNVILIDENNIHSYVPSISIKGSKQVLSDILRINLLAEHGGIWVDATCFCVKALDSWIYDYMTYGFFAFERPAADRMLSSWFIACHKNNYIARVYQRAVNLYWDNNINLSFVENSRWRVVNRFQRRFGTQLWFSGFVTKILKVYPYFWFHYLFENIYKNDGEIKRLWDSTPKISADVPHSLQIEGLFKRLNEEIKNEILNKTSPCYKLTWKFDTLEPGKDSIMDYLLK